VPAERLRDAVAAGLTVLGENRVQEGEAKAADVPGATWHLVGPLQSNKARRALEVFDVIESVDSLALAQRLDRIAGEIRPGTRYPVLVQVNVDLDPAKSGFLPSDAEEAMPALLALQNLRIGGLMTVGRLTGSATEARGTFRGLRQLADRIRGRLPDLGTDLSMGMTDDFEIAVEEGATIVRVGRALFGERRHEHGDGDVDHTH
jgi:pyridoxal phosphate enzyme (YggS family)